MKDLVSSDDFSRQEKRGLLGFEVSYGSVRGWKVELSTLPQQRGARLINAGDHNPSSSELRTALSNHAEIVLGAIPPKGGWGGACI